MLKHICENCGRSGAHWYLFMDSEVTLCKPCAKASGAKRIKNSS